MIPLNELMVLYKKAEAEYDISKRIEIFMMAQEHVSVLTKNEKAANDFFLLKSDILFCGIIFYLQQKNGLQALRCFDYLSEKIFNKWPWLIFYKALAFYETGDMEKAREMFLLYSGQYPLDENTYFYLGNIHLKRGEALAALQLYTKTLERRHNFFEALANSAIALEMQGESEAALQLLRQKQTAHYVCQGNIVEYAWDSSALKMEDVAEICNIPIFINARDRLECLQKLICWLHTAGYRRIYILDNASTYAPLLRYYKQLQDSGQAEVIYLHRNMGHTAVWDSGILERMSIATPYVYTDPDVLPVEQCPADVLSYLWQILADNPLLDKVGLDLVASDISYFGAEETKAYSYRSCQIPLARDVYFATVDTTFALYRNYRHYSLFAAAKTGGNLMARHLPWYYDYGDLPVDELYYMAHANESSTITGRFKVQDKGE